MWYYFQDTEEDEQEIENGIEVRENQILPLIEDLPSPSIDCSIEDTTEDQPLIPGLENTRNEPDYSTMDNMTLLSTLSLQDNTNCNDSINLISNLDS